MTTVLALDTLRAQLAQVLPAERPAVPGLPTGVDALDRVLPGGGLPRGRLTEVVGRRSSGRTTLLRQVVQATRRDGGWVAWIDGARTLAPRDWVTPATEADGAPPLWIVRPPREQAARGAWCADVLLRSGAFALVVLDGAPPLPRAIAVRLGRLAQDVGAAFVVLGDDDGGSASRIGGALRLRVERAERAARTDRAERKERAERPEAASRARGRRLRITIEKGGSQQPVEVSCAIGVARRLCAHPEIPDRRGVARRDRRSGLRNAAHGPAPAGARPSGEGAAPARSPRRRGRQRAG